MSQTTLSTSQSAAPTRSTTSRASQELWATVEGLLYLAPTLIGLGIFVFWPIVRSFQLSLNRIAPFGNQMRFVGFDNYTNLFADPQYWDSVRVSLLFVLGTVPVGIALAVLLAIMLAYPLRHLSWLHRTLIFVPIVISSAVTGVIFRWIYHPIVGYLNYGMVQLGLFETMQDAPNWLSSKDWALLAVIAAVVWRQLGFNVIIALAGVQNIDNSFYEAAKIDGANALHRIRHITLPLLSPTLFFLLIVNIIFSFQAFGEIDVLTQGGPGRATQIMSYDIYYDAFVGTPMRGLASTKAYLLAVMVVLMSYINFVTANRRVHYQ